ncbi:MAG TPA: rhombosortase [Thermoanaerobaculia bacterium]
MRRLPWVTAALVGCAALLSTLDGLPARLEYDRALVRAGELWRPLTAQLVHWTPRMALADLAALALLGGWLEARGRRRGLAAGLLLAAAATAVGIHFLLPRLATYRGSSGLAAALFVLVAVELAAGPGPARRRLLAVAALALFAGKVLYETATGRAAAAGALPAGVAVVPLVHLLGGAAGLLAALLTKRRPVPLPRSGAP